MYIAQVMDQRKHLLLELFNTYTGIPMKYTIEIPMKEHNFVTQRQFVVGKIYKCIESLQGHPKPYFNYLHCYVWLTETPFFHGKYETGYILVTNGCLEDGIPLEFSSAMKTGLEFSDNYKFVEMPVGTKILRNEVIMECK